MQSRSEVHQITAEFVPSCMVDVFPFVNMGGIGLLLRPARFLVNSEFFELLSECTAMRWVA